MAHKIDQEKCVGCGACKETCPAGAISEADGKCVIDFSEIKEEVLFYDRQLQ